MDMFCFQCEQTYMGSGCIGVGQCGKDPESAALQDLIVHACKGLAQYAHRAAVLGADVPAEAQSFTLMALFSTLTNVNFDPERLGGIADELAVMRDRMRDLYETTARQKGVEPEALSGTATWKPEDDLGDMIKQAAGVGIAARMKQLDQDLLSLQELITYGLKGLAAYADHAEVLGQTIPRSTPSSTRRSTSSPRSTASTSLWPCRCGWARSTCKAMELLDRGQHRRLRPPRAHARARHAGQGQGHRGLGPRSEGPRGAAEADRGQGDQCLHPRRDAARPRLPGAQEVQAPGRATTAAPGRISARSSTRFPARS